MENSKEDIYNYKNVRNSLARQNKFDLVEWLDNNRTEYTKAILNNEHQLIGFYYD
jgi:hypothetical protein